MYTAEEQGVKIKYLSNIPKKYVGYYSKAASFKRYYTIQYLKKRFKLEDSFVYLDGFCSTGIMGILVKHTFKLAKIVLNDKLVSPGLILHNQLMNGQIPYKNLKEDFTKLNTSAQVVDIDPYGSSIPYWDYISTHKPSNLIITQTDLINLCSRRGCVNYFKSLGVNVVFTSFKNELAVRALLYVLYKKTSLTYSLKDLLVRDKYFTLYLQLKSELKHITYGYYYVCFCGFSTTELGLNCLICNRPLKLVGPLYTSSLKDMVGGFNKEHYSTIRKIQLSDKKLTELVPYNIRKSSVDAIFKFTSYSQLVQSISILDRVYLHKDL